MDEFTSIAIWLLIIYLSINTMIIWFSTSTTFDDNNLGIQGLTPNDDSNYTNYSLTGLGVIKSSFFGITVNCDSVSNDLLAFAPCWLARASNVFTSFMNTIWVFLTAWTNLLTAILTPIPGGTLFLNIVVPMFGLIELIALIVVLMRVAAIVRGVAGGFL